MTQQPPPSGWGPPASASGSPWSVPERDGPASEPPPPPPGPPAPGSPAAEPVAAGGAPAANGWGAAGGAGWQQLSGPPPAPQGSLVARRGIVSPKPLGFGDYFDGAFRAIRHNPRVMLGTTALVVGLSTLLATVPLVGLVTTFVDATVDPAAEPSDADIAATLTAVGGFLLASLVQGAALVVLNGLLMVSVSQSVLDRRLTAGELWRRVRGRVVALVAQSLLLGLGASVLFTLALAPGFTLVLLGEVVAGGLAFGVLGVAAALLALWLWTMLLVAPAALVIERLGVLSSLRRSFQLVRGAFWRTLLVYLLAVVLTNVVAQAASLPIAFVTGIISALFPDNLVVVGAIQAVGVTLGTLVGSVLAVPFLASVVALVYVDRRIRREGLDVVLSQALEGRPA